MSKDYKCDPVIHQTKKGNQYYSGAKAHIGGYDESELELSVVVIADVNQVEKLLRGAVNLVWADAGYTGVEKREEYTGAKSSGRV